MAELLDDQELRTALEALDGWHGDRAAISRTVTLPASEQPALLDELEHLAREMNHDPDLDIAGHDVTIVMSTHSEGGVTRLDVDYAHRVDDLVRGLA
ncbi:MAG TPA: 4a-hydroxytetrahydrobiopterin dehydratase [Mycobacteriales bacterium]|nr:4a-hydroxytetrahydrobiopterin dehydratase [Mycobacteriales bacterium]